MIFDVYYPFRNKAGKMCPGTRPKKMEWMQVMDVMGSKYVGDLCSSPHLVEEVRRRGFR